LCESKNEQETKALTSALWLQAGNAKLHLLLLTGMRTSVAKLKLDSRSIAKPKHEQENEEVTSTGNRIR
jgi:hypothetical protein